MNDKTTTDKIVSTFIGFLLVFLWHFLLQFFPLYLNVSLLNEALDFYSRLVVSTGFEYFQLFYVVPLLILYLYKRNYFMAIGTVLAVIVTYMISDQLYGLYLRYLVFEGMPL